MAESVPGELLSCFFLLLDDQVRGRSFANEHVHVANLIHDRAEASAFALETDGHLGDVHGVHVAFERGDTHLVEHVGLLQALAVNLRGGHGEPSAMATHNLVDNEHARVGSGFVNDRLEEHGTLFSGGISTQRLQNWVDIVIHGLGESENLQSDATLLQVEGQPCSCRVGIISTDGVKDGDAVLHKPVASDVLRNLAFLHKLSLHAILDVLELHTAVSNGGSSIVLEKVSVAAHLPVDLETVPDQETLVPVTIAEDFDVWVNLRVTFNQSSHSRRETWCQTPRSEDANLVFLIALGLLQDCRKLFLIYHVACYTA
mmetsp:Transcript_24869/g.48594  ORF Transcript_24869/g.48594 Transcript_24869/m.48594 type:complete len:315 (-) Transcript_24869:41-985(-)